MKKIGKNILKGMGLIIAVYCISIFIALAYRHITIGIPEHRRHIAQWESDHLASPANHK